MSGNYKSWSVSDITEFMQGEQQADAQLGEIRSNLFRAHAYNSIMQGFEVYWQVLEADWKRVTNGKPLPSAHRSSKSVIKNALACEDPTITFDENGDVRGKTAIEKLIKEHRAKAKAEELPAPGEAGTKTSKKGKKSLITLDDFKQAFADLDAAARAELRDTDYEEFWFYIINK